MLDQISDTSDPNAKSFLEGEKNSNLPLLSNAKMMIFLGKKVIWISRLMIMDAQKKRISQKRKILYTEIVDRLLELQECFFFG